MTTKPTVRVVGAAIGLPLLWAAAAVALLVVWRSDLPDPIAVHWGANMMPDGFGSPDTPILITAVAGVVAALVGIVVVVTSSSSTVARTLASLLSGVVAFLAVILLLTVAVQRGAADAAQVAFPAWAIPLAGAIGIGAGYATAAIIPRWHAGAVIPEGEAPTAISIAPNERVVWSSVVSSSGPGVLVGGLAVVLTALWAVAFGVWPMLVVTVTLAVMMTVLCTIRLTADRHGLRIRSLLGFPRVVIPLAAIASVSTVRVRALRDFGGIGYRVAIRGPLRGARGFVLRSGDALMVTTTDGRTEVVVVDDPQTGAAVLEGLRRREVRQSG